MSERRTGKPPARATPATAVTACARVAFAHGLLQAVSGQPSAFHLWLTADGAVFGKG